MTTTLLRVTHAGTGAESNLGTLYRNCFSNPLERIPALSRHKKYIRRMKGTISTLPCVRSLNVFQCNNRSKVRSWLKWESKAAIHKSVGEGTASIVNVQSMTIQSTNLSEELHREEAENEIGDVLELEANEFIKPLEGSVEQDSPVPDLNVDMHEKRASTTPLKSRIVPNLPCRSKYRHDDQLSFWEESKVITAFEGYLFIGSRNEAMRTLNQYRRDGHTFQVSTYNTLLQCAVSAKDSVLSRMLLQSMETQSVTFNLHTYAILIQMAMIDKDVGKVREILEKIEENHTIDSIFRNCPLTSKESAIVLDAVKLVHPDYAPNTTVEKEFICNTRLLGSIYSTLEPYDVRSVLDKVKRTTIMGELSLQETQCLDIRYLTNKNIMERLEEQLANEKGYYVTVKSIENKSQPSKKIIKRQKLFSKICQSWKEQFVVELQRVRDLQVKEGSVDGRTRRALLPYLYLLEPEAYAEVIFKELIPALAMQSSGLSALHLCRKIGDMIFNIYSLKYKESKFHSEVVRKIYDDFGSYASDPENMSNVFPRQMWHFLQKNNTLSNDKHITMTWPLQIKLMVSGFLLDIFMRVALLDSKQLIAGGIQKVQALEHEQQFVRGRMIGILKLHPLICKLFKSHLADKGELAIESFKVPMVIPPKPWTSVDHGGYLLQPSSFVRTVLEEYSHSELKRCSDEGRINAIFDAINYLASCPWKVNNRILDLMIDLYNDKGDPSLEIAPPPNPASVFSVTNDMTAEEKSDILKEKKKWKKEFHEMHALRMGQLYHLSVAAHLRDKIFWLPYNLDFRGRVYTIPPYSTHTGSDFSRALMLFAKGKPLGEHGLDWLKVHIVNLHGEKKKGSLRERIEFANQSMDDIIDSADNPFTGRQWWRSAEEPWQVLAACAEITAAIRSPDHTQFISYLPIQQDGLCNGHQHYAALGRDQYGADKVCVTPSEKPQDLYSEVTNLVEEQRKVDAKNGDEIAIFLEGKIARKVVKQTVMTITYGVTLIGGRLQIERQLRDLGDYDDNTLYKASFYLANKVFASIGQLFQSSSKIQDWLSQAAVDISSTGQPVSWVTPLGLPIVQPYHVRTREIVNTPLQSLTTRTFFDQAKKADSRKQKAGFPPNFIHSLDSTHMLLTALHCQKEEVLFASVHDSYWTHASDVPTMNRICREQFLKLHSEPLLNDLQASFKERFGPFIPKQRMKGKKECFDNLPRRGDLDLTQVLQSTYFFS